MKIEQFETETYKFAISGLFQLYFSKFHVINAVTGSM